MTHWDSPMPAASLIILRKGSCGFDVLLLKRNPDLAYLGGVWVFPGGRIEKKDYGETGDMNLPEAALKAAIPLFGQKNRAIHCESPETGGGDAIGEGKNLIRIISKQYLPVHRGNPSFFWDYILCIGLSGKDPGT